MKNLYKSFCLATLFFSVAGTAQTTLISPTVNNGGFESGNAGWNIVNGAQTNRWFIGNNYQCNGSQSAYIGTAVGNNNYNNGTGSVVHLYRDFTFPAGQSQIDLSFTLRAGGESTFDGLRVYVISTATTPVAGTQNALASLVGNTWYNLTGGTCATYNITLSPALAGTTQRLVFQWRNDGSLGTNPGATLDDVTIITQVPPAPNCATMTAPANGATNVCESSVTLNWNTPVGGGAPTGYKLYFGTNNFPTNIVNGTNIGLVNTYNPGVLLPNTTYYWSIVPTNGAGDAVGCSVFSFTTGAGCYVQPQTGTVTYNACGGNYYDPGGPAANYNANANSTVTFCPSVAGQYVQVNFTAFNLETCCDFLTVYNGPTTASPVLGTYTGTSLPCNLTSTHVSGCLTFRFVSDGSVQYLGWAATVSCVAAPSGPFAGSICGNALSITMPYTATGETTACYGNDYTNLSTGSCGTLYESGEDHVYALTVGAATCIGVSLTNCSSSNIGFQVYSGCPGNAGTTCIASAGGSSPLSGNATLPAAGTYYIIVDSWSAPMNVNYDISVTNFGSGPTNDLPCNATTLALNVNLTGDNTCSGSASEPAAATCWSAGNMNTVWYRVVCPASGQLRIRTTLGSLTNTQIALYSGTCGALTQVACNDNAPACGSSTYLNSEITATGLTSGANYWIRVDGVNNLTGTFDIMAVDGAVGFPAAAGQDCSSPNPVCAASISVGNPGYQAYGNICDFPGGGGNCLASGERGSCWYNIPINANGTLAFDIVPNDWPGAPSTAGTDYDFAVWKVAGSGATNCAGIAAGAVPLRCNYSGLGVTGCYTTTGTAPPAYPGFGGAYEANIAVTNGDVYLLVISNFSNSTSGFTLNFSAGSPINYTAVGSTVSWTGGTNTSWTLASNWGGCNPPACGINAVVGPASFNQPVLGPGNYYVNNLTINSGGVLTLQAGANLHICGNFSNSGSIVANAASTITFDNAAAVQSMSGAFVGADALGNLVINKTGGQVTCLNNIDLKGSFTTSNVTSVFNPTNMYMKVAGNFTNASGNTTFNPNGTTVEFNGSAAQTYNQGNAILYMNNVVMNHTGPGVTCATNMVFNIIGTLTLTQGKIITNANEVYMRNPASASVTPGNLTSFVQGNLRRVLNGAATSYDFPVGSATTGYNRANITFTTATTIPELVARFDNYAPPLGPAANECPNNTYNTLPMLNNGYWTINASANPTSGTYTTTLYNNGYTNSAGAAGWTVAKGTSTATFALNGTCAASTVNTVVRTGMNGFSVFGVAQSVAPLPVELVSFSGIAHEDHNELVWETASENNNHYFDVERSDDGVNFYSIGRRIGHGTTSQAHSYSFDDFAPLEGTNYYRLKQVDYNGAVMYTAIVTLEFHRGNMTLTNVKPNPTSGEVNFDFNSPYETTVHIMITDITGRVVRDEYQQVKTGTTPVYTQIEDQGAGVYTMIVTEDRTGFRSVTRIVKY